MYGLLDGVRPVHSLLIVHRSGVKGIIGEESLLDYAAATSLSERVDASLGPGALVRTHVSYSVLLGICRWIPMGVLQAGLNVLAWISPRTWSFP